MKVREVLGIDISRDRLCVVELRRPDVGNGVILTRWARALLPPGADAGEIASILRRTIADEGFIARVAVLGLPPGSGFLQTRRARQPGAGESHGEPAGLSDLDYVTDTWTTADGRSVRGVASRADITRTLQIAAQASLEPLAVELRSMGYLTSLALPEPRRRDGGAADVGLVIDEDSITGVLTDRQAPVVVHTRPRKTFAQGAIERKEDLLANIERMLRTIRMGHPEVFGEGSAVADEPGKGDTGGKAARDEQRPPGGVTVRVIAGDDDRRALAGLGDRLGLAVEIIEPGRSVGLCHEGPGPENPARYAAAIGLAIEGMGLSGKASPAGRKDQSPRAFNFLHPTRAKRRSLSLPAISWRTAAVAFAAVAVLLVATAVTVAWHKHNVLADLKGQYERRAPSLRRQQEVADRWRMLRPWVARAGGGSRIASGRNYVAIGKLFPSSDDVYITRLSLQRDQDPPGVSIRIEGRAQAAAALFDFVSRLNASKRFERARLGSVTDAAEASSYPKRFTLTFNLREDR